MSPRSLVSLLLLPLTGCLSTQYLPASKDTPPAVPLNLAAETPSVSVLLDAVVVFRGPGSWKRKALWDEYVVAFTNRGAAPVIIETALLFALEELGQMPRGDPWQLEELSRQKLRQYEDRGLAIQLGAGPGTSWIVPPPVSLGGAHHAPTTIAAAGAAALAGLPGRGLDTLIFSASPEDRAANEIQQEFQRRRLVFPFMLTVHEAKSGSLFFPVTPGPKRLVLHYRAGTQSGDLTLDLAPLAGLHLQPDATKKS